jgi:hypothetical protein
MLGELRRLIRSHVEADKAAVQIGTYNKRSEK